MGALYSMIWAFALFFSDHPSPHTHTHTHINTHTCLWMLELTIKALCTPPFFFSFPFSFSSQYIIAFSVKREHNGRVTEWAESGSEWKTEVQSQWEGEREREGGLRGAGEKCFRKSQEKGAWGVKPLAPVLRRASVVLFVCWSKTFNVSAISPLHRKGRYGRKGGRGRREGWMEVRGDETSEILLCSGCNTKRTLQTEGAQVEERKKASACNVTVSGSINIF